MNHQNALASPTSSACVALTSLLAIATVTGACDFKSANAKNGAPAPTVWRLKDVSQTSATAKMKVAAKPAYTPKTPLGRELAALRARIVAAGGTKPAAALLAEIEERRGQV